MFTFEFIILNNTHKAHKMDLIYCFAYLAFLNSCSLPNCHTPLPPSQVACGIRVGSYAMWFHLESSDQHGF